MLGLKPRNPAKPARHIAVLMIGGMAVGGLMGLASELFEANTFPALSRYMLPLTLVVVIGLVTFSLWVGARWMNSIDEAAQEAHKWAWYWGGSFGMAFGMVGLCVGMLPLAENITIPSAFSGRTDPMAYAATGAFALLTLMILGYLVAWGVWWLRRR